MINPNVAALLIRATLGAMQIRQVELAAKLGINEGILSRFLNRRIDLIQPDIERILKELGIFEQTCEQSATLTTSIKLQLDVKGQLNTEYRDQAE